MKLDDISNRLPKLTKPPGICIPVEPHGSNYVDPKSQSLFKIDEEPEEEKDPIEYFFDLLDSETIKGILKYDQCA